MVQHIPTRLFRRMSLIGQKAKDAALCNEVRLGATGIWDTVCVIRVSLSGFPIKTYLKAVHNMDDNYNDDDQVLKIIHTTTSL